MHKLETHFIPENVAPAGTEKIVVLNESSTGVGTIPLNGLAHPTLTPRRRVLVLSDIHITEETAAEDFDRALAYGEKNCDFAIIAGDLTDDGIPSDYNKYVEITSKYPNLHIYAIAGNHENYSNRDPALLKGATGYSLYYKIEDGNDVYVMVGHYGGYRNGNWQSDDFVSLDELQWLYETLEENRDRRCFVVNHAFPYTTPPAQNVGNPLNFYTSVLPWRTTDGYIGQAYISLLRHYKNTFLFSGHSHARLELQAVESTANYSDADGYKHIHIPSLSVPRDIKSGSRVNVPEASQGYVMEVYDGLVVLNGFDLVNLRPIPIGCYKIQTPIQPVEAGTYVDNLGIIKT